MRICTSFQTLHIVVLSFSSLHGSSSTSSFRVEHSRQDLGSFSPLTLMSVYEVAGDNHCIGIGVTIGAQSKDLESF